MIPWKMWFTGIRDYKPTVMDLSGEKSNILITGPNGAGKSTITYCMGVVLYSSKVEIDGLKSRNLLPNDTWKANIRILFKNKGRMRIDVPTYVEFSIYILQESGQPIKKEFVIHSGDDPEQWDETIKYTSGDRQYNFTTYKKDLQYKYKIDPDSFYLIWYQQEVNQFAVMDPQERFRIFAEMHGIDQVQRNWEESIEQLKEVQENLRTAEVNVAHKKQWLGLAHTALERYEDNYKRLVEGGKLYAGALLRLELYYKQEQLDLVAKKEQLLIDQDSANEHFDELQDQVEQLTNVLKRLKEEKDGLDSRSKPLQQQLLEVKQEINETMIVIEDLNTQLKELSQEKSRIIRSEEEVHEQLADITSQLTILNNEITEAKANNQKIDEYISSLLNSSAKLNAQIEQDHEQEQTHQERLRQHLSSHHVNESIKALEESVDRMKKERDAQSKQLQELTDEKQQLENNKLWSERQKESLALFRTSGVRAYALNELIELNEAARPTAEEQFAAIKYTIFFDGSYVQAPNDLYHVPLRSIVPDRSFTEIQTLQLHVKNELSEEVFPHAVKALWWVEQFYEADEIQIENGMLIDSKGIRGPQEKKSYILSQRAMEKRKEELQEKISQLNNTLGRLQATIPRDTVKMQELHALIQSVRESEAFLTRKHEREGRVSKYRDEVRLLQEQRQLSDQSKELQTMLIKHQIRLDHTQDILNQEADFYVRLGQQKQQFETLQRSKQRLESLSLQQEGMKKQQSELEEQMEYFDNNERRQRRNLENTEDKLQQADRLVEQIKRQITDTAEALDASKLNMLTSTEEIEHLKGLAKAIYDEAASELEVELNHPKRQHSLTKLRQDKESGKVVFMNARHEPDIDPAAPDNYKVLEAEVHRLQDEYKRTNLLFEENQERVENLRDQLETTINMRVLEIQQRFKNYMSMFQFEGQIDWNQREDRQGRMLFELFIKARKEGHRGALVDVSTKARGGRVGKGVSGGEESLTSLLFALALLQNLRTAPGFIVMDEFDSALDEQRKLKVFDLYASELQRKLIILSPKSHENSYLDRFSKAYVVHHDPTMPRSKVTGLVMKGV